MTILKRLYFFVPLTTPEKTHYINLINKYRLMYLQKGIQCHIYDSGIIEIPPTVIYLIGQSHIVASAQAVNDEVIQKIVSINIVIQQAP